MTREAGENSFDFWRGLAARDPESAARALLTRVYALDAATRRALFAHLPTADELTRELARGRATDGPLAGVPFMTKDLFAIGGHTTGAGSTFLSKLHKPAEADAPLVAWLRQAGAVLAGVTQLHEFAYGLTGENPHFGDPPNLRHPGRLAGGSSSGSAAVVGGNIVPLALGTDTGGSVRVPAAFNGIWGYRMRPDDRWIEHCFPLSPSLDTAGWFTGSAADMLSVLRVILGEAAPPTAHGFVFVPARLADAAIPRDYAERFDTAAARFAEPLPPDEAQELARAFDEAPGTYVVIQSSEAAAVHAEWLDAHRPEYDPAVWQRLDRGRRWSSAQIANAREERERLRSFVHDLLAERAGLVLPAAPFPALTKSECTDENRSRILRLTTLASLAGAPVLTVPFRFPNGLAAGLQVILPSYLNRAAVDLLRDWTNP